MFTVPVILTQLIVEFAPLFYKRVWEHVQVLVVGALLVPGKRTGTAVLRVMGRSQEQQFQKYHRVLNSGAVVESSNSARAVGSVGAHLCGRWAGRDWGGRYISHYPK